MTCWKWLCYAVLITPVAAMAKPDLSKPQGPTIADTGSSHYRFSRFDLDSADGDRHYRIWIGEPRKASSSHGRPVIYLLDGNAAMGALDDPQLAELERGEPPVIVAVGYATPLRFDTTARAYDYTPPLPKGEPVVDDLARDRKGGGADVFLDLLEHRIKPAVESRAPIDRGRQTLWGHSYGGLFALHTLFTRPGMFQHYVAGDPSLWWKGGFILSEADAYVPSENQPTLLLMKGMATRERPADGEDRAQVQRREHAVNAFPPDATEKLAHRLAANFGMSVSYQAFPELGHGPMLPASLRQALRGAAGITSAEAGK
ncbi:alpha/beta hydrolase [Pseudomonas sp. Marseille-QA0892]